MSHNSKNILFIEDDTNVLNSFTFILRQEGYNVFQASSGEEAIKLASTCQPDIVLLDICLPGIDGFEVARRLKELPNTSSSYYVMLTGYSIEDDIVEALNKYTDEYIAKPVKPRLLLARLQAILRRRNNSSTDLPQISVHGLILNPSSREALLEDRPIDLTKTEYDILHLLLSSPNQVHSRQDILSNLKGDKDMPTSRTIDFQICGLRKKIGNLGSRLETVRGIGYKFRV